MLESRTPTVQPSAVIDPQPIKTPPNRAVELFLIVGISNLNLLADNAPAKDASTKPMMSYPLLLIVSVTSPTQPANVSRPLIVSGNSD